MRRLNNIEKILVNKIVSEGQVNLNYLLNGFRDENIGFGIDVDGKNQPVNVFYKKQYYNSTIHNKDFFETEFKKALIILFLLEELEREHLIYFSSTDDSSRFKTISPYFGSVDCGEFDTENPVDGEDYVDIIFAPAVIIVKKLLRVINKQINSTPALEVYKANGFRTEEQKANDRSFHFGWAGITVAILTAILTPLLTDCSNSNSAEISERKTEFFRNELINQVDNISTNTDSLRKYILNQKKLPIQTKTPNTTQTTKPKGKSSKN